MKALKEMTAIERAELLTRVISESLHVTEEDKDIALFWVRDLLEPLKNQLREEQNQSD
jgi:hypothetical protein